MVKRTPDCFNEYYTAKLISEHKIKKLMNDETFIEYENSSKFKLNSKATFNLLSFVQIDFNYGPDTIYTH